MRYLYSILSIMIFGVTGVIAEPRSIEQFNGGYYMPVNVRHADSLTPSGTTYYDFLDKNPDFSNKCHLANDYYKPIGSPVFAISDGIVVRRSDTASNYGGFDSKNNSIPGGVIFVKHDMDDEGTMYGLYGHINDIQVQVGDTVVGGQLLGFIMDYRSGGRSFPHLHFGLTSRLPTNLNSFPGYTPTNNCSNLLSFVNPEPILEALSNHPVGYEWHGSGSLIKPSGNCPGCQVDYVKLHDTNQKPFGVFQWKKELGTCEGIEISATGKHKITSVDTNLQDLRISLRAGDWKHRNSDGYFIGELPLSIGYPYKKFNLVSVMLPVPLSELTKKYQDIDFSEGVLLEARCVPVVFSNSRKKLVTNNQYGVQMVQTTNVWSGTGSIINSQQFLISAYGISKDVAHIRTKEEARFPVTTFQWQPNYVGIGTCDRLRFEAVQSDEKPYVLQPIQARIRFKNWEAPPLNSRTYNVTLPWTLNQSIASYSHDNYYVISVELLKRYSQTILPMYIKATCQ